MWKCGGRKGVIAHVEAIKTSGGKGQFVIKSPKDFNTSSFKYKTLNILLNESLDCFKFSWLRIIKNNWELFSNIINILLRPRFMTFWLPVAYIAIIVYINCPKLFPQLFTHCFNFYGSEWYQHCFQLFEFNSIFLLCRKNLMNSRET